MSCRHRAIKKELRKTFRPYGSLGQSESPVTLDWVSKEIRKTQKNVVMEKYIQGLIFSSEWSKTSYSLCNIQGIIPKKTGLHSETNCGIVPI